MKTTGLDLEREIAEQSDQDWVFGSLSDPCITDWNGVIRQEYLPKGEVQRGAEDFMDCATRSPINLLETKFNFLLRKDLLLPENKAWLTEKGYVVGNNVEFSDRFNAILSNTTRSGNSLKAPIQCIHEFGLIPKSLLPRESGMTWNDYHDKSKITSEMLALGKEFKKRFTINYDRVYANQLGELLKDELVGVAVHAWPSPVNGEYPRNTGTINHAVLGLENPQYHIFDNYEESEGDFIKKLAKDYIFWDYGYRVYISSQQPVTQINLLQKLLSLYQQLLDLVTKKKDMTNSELFIEKCLNKEGTDFTPDWVVSDEVSCAFAVSTVLKEVIPEMPIIVNTGELYRFMKDNTKYFREVPQPIDVMKPGYICVSPTGMNSRPEVMPHGHVGVYIDDTNIMSNDSASGNFVKNYTRDTWRNRYYYKGGYPIKIFELI